VVVDLELTLVRFGYGRDSTLGVLQIEGLHECWTLEDERRKVKVKGETCIPVGRYEVGLRTEGGMNKRYEVRFPLFHRGMLWIKKVLGFQYIYFHPGNDDDDTEGCVLMGRHPMILPDGEFKVADSVSAYKTLYKKIIKAFDDGRRVFVTVMEVEPQ